jgi:hypothetical protein
MSEIKRYNADGTEDVNGYLVAYDDHLAAIKQAKIDAVRDLMPIIEAVAHIGVDFGHGKYDLEPMYIHDARVIIEQLKEQGGE